jgi:hypothetical protein
MSDKDDNEYAYGEINAFRQVDLNNFTFPVLEVFVSMRGTILIKSDDDEGAFFEFSPLMAERLAKKIFEVHGELYGYYVEEMLKDNDDGDDTDDKPNGGFVC